MIKNTQNYNKYTSLMNLKIFIVITVLACLSACDNILLILDNAQLTQTHSKLIDMLKTSHNV